MTAAWYGQGGSIELRPSHRRWRFWVETGRDELPDVRSTADLIPFRRGGRHRQGTADRRPLVLRGYIKEASDAALLATRDSLKALLDPESYAPGTLVDEFEDGTERWIRAVPRNLLSKYGGDAARILSIELEALDPYWYGALGMLTLDGNYGLDQGEVLDSSAELVIAGTGEIEVNTRGTADVERVRVRIAGPSSGPIGLEVLTVPRIGFTLDRTLVAGEVAEIDNFARSCRLGSGTVRAALTLSPGNRHGEFLRLPKGPITLRATGGALETRILFSPTYQ